jgi:hypothetical protein
LFLSATTIGDRVLSMTSAEIDQKLAISTIRNNPMDNPLNVSRLKLFTLSFLSITALSNIVTQPIFAAEVNTPAQIDLVSIPKIVTKSATLLIASKRKVQKRRKVRATKPTSQSSKRQKTSTLSTVQPNSSAPPAPADNPSAQLTPTPLEQAPIPTTVQPTKPSAPRDNYSINVEGYYSSWSDNFGNNGNQLVTPLTVTYAKDDFNVGVRTAFINSNFNGVLLLDGQKIGTRQGSVSTQSDTSLSLAYTLKKSAYPVRFNLDFNIPTGKATLFGDQKNAIMDGSLVQQTRFGEGFNIAPGVSVSHAFGSKDVIGAGASYIVRGKFNPLGDVLNSAIDPGDEAVATLQYQHSDRNFLAMGGLIYTNYGTTKRGDKDYYRSGDRLDANVTGIFAPFDGHRVQLTGRYFTQSPNTVVNFFTGDLAKESANSNGNAVYVALDWGIATDRQQKGRVHALVDYLNIQANSYDRINDLYNAGRNKFSVGVGYDYSFSPSTSASIQAKYFQVLDKATPISPQDLRSSGLSLYTTINYNF